MAAAPARRLLRSLAAAGVGRRLLSRAESEISLALATPSTEEVSTGREKWHTPEPAEPYLGSGRQPLDRLTSYCWIEDWSNAALVAAMRRQLPYLVEKDPRFPENLEHRKHWEYAQVVVGLEQLGALHQDALVLGVGAGHEEAIYDLSTRVRWLFATDIYGSGYFRAGEADARMLLDPDHFARCPYNRNRLVVENMDALDLRFEDRTFDAVYSLSSIEHFGGLAGATRALDEMARVLKPSGIVALTTECVINDESGLSRPGLEVFTHDGIRSLVSSVPALNPVGKLDFSLSAKTRALKPIRLSDAVADAKRGHTEYPHVLIELDGCVYTSFSVFLQKTAAATR